MAEIGGGGYRYDGADAARPQQWKCPNCRALNVGKIEDGCSACGTGTAAEREAAIAKRTTLAITVERLVEEIVGRATPLSVAMVEARGLTEKARATVATALAFYAEHGEPTLAELPRAVVLAWGRRIAEAVAEVTDVR